MEYYVNFMVKHEPKLYISLSKIKNVSELETAKRVLNKLNFSTCPHVYISHLCMQRMLDSNHELKGQGESHVSVY
jgi:hypothetical protein